MKLNQNQQNKIDQYLNGELKGELLDNFLKDIKMNPILLKEVELQSAIAKGVESYGNDQLRKRFKKIHQEVKTETTTPKVERGRVIRLAIAVAAVAAMFLIVFNFFGRQEKTSGEIFTQYYTPFELSIQRNTVNQVSLAQAEQFYSNQDYKRAIPLLQSILAENHQNSKIQLALGNALLEEGDFSQAIQNFQDIINRNDTEYTDQAKWFLAMTYLKNNDVINAKKWVEMLAADSEADFHKEAKAVMSDF